MTIHEGSPVVEIVAGADLEFRCASGTVRAEKGVLAINAWMTHLADVRPYVFAVSSDIVATPPIPERLGQLGYTGREHATNSRMMVNYCRTTADGRLVFGRAGSGTLARGGRISPAFDYSRKEAAEVEQDFRMWYPMLADVPAVDAWSGPIDKSQCGLPWFGALGHDDRIRYAVGYSGAGVAQTVLGGRVVASMVLGIQDEWAATGRTLNRIHGGGRLPPEPIRYFGGRLVQAAVKSKDSHEAHGKRPPWLAVQLSRLVPGGDMPTSRAKP